MIISNSDNSVNNALTDDTSTTVTPEAAAARDLDTVAHEKNAYLFDDWCRCYSRRAMSIVEHICASNHFNTEDFLVFVAEASVCSITNAGIIRGPLFKEEIAVLQTMCPTFAERSEERSSGILYLVIQAELEGHKYDRTILKYDTIRKRQIVFMLPVDIPHSCPSVSGGRPVDNLGPAPMGPDSDMSSSRVSQEAPLADSNEAVDIQESEPKKNDI
jgi:hypothetical protein